MQYTLKEIANICNGTVVGEPTTVVTGFFTDSRQADEHKMFVAIKGEKTDGHKFVDMVFAKKSSVLSEENLETTGNYVIVENSVKALQQIALDYRNKFTIPFVGITGSVGKTSAKEMVALALESELDVLKTLGNANSQVGVPLTLMRVEDNHQTAIIEMGMSLPGEMERLAYSARPQYAVFTNVGVSHIEYHGSKEKIMEEKLRITDYFNNTSILFVNGDDPLLAELTAKYKIVKFGLSDNCEYRAVDVIEDDNGTSFNCRANGDTVNIKLQTYGAHNIRNALSALAVADTLGVSRDNSIKAISSYTPPTMRQQVKKVHDLTVIDDSYNASPDSTFTALDVLNTVKGSRKIALIGDMLELGDYSKKGHESVGEYAKSLNLDFLIGFGEEAQHTVNAFADKEKSKWFTDYDEARNFLLNLVQTDDVVLCKGSRGMKTDRFVEAIENKYQGEIK